MTTQSNGVVDPLAHLPVSLLDTDLYKLTMQKSVRQHFPNAEVSYAFTNRSKGDTKFTKRSVEKIQKVIDRFSDLTLQPSEKDYLRFFCPYFSEDYLSFLSSLSLDPSSQVQLTFLPASTGWSPPPQLAQLNEGEEWGDIQLEVKGLWKEVILYEVPLMAIISEAYFAYVDRCWDYRGQRTLGRTKGLTLLRQGVRLSEFGTRRRRSYKAQRLVMEGLVEARDQVEKEVASGQIAKEAVGALTGTSNVHFAHMFKLSPVGTIAHEFTMGVAAMYGYDHCNLRSLQLWEQTYPQFPELTIALTDTFSTRVFFDDLLSSPEGRDILRRWRGLRQDSGDPLVFARRAKEVYKVELGMTEDECRKKTIVYSDSLDPERCVMLKKASDEIGVGCSFGVGTNLTNDFKRLTGDQFKERDDDPDGEVRSGEKSKPLNIVIKLSSIDGRHAVKISDDLSKSTGDPETIQWIEHRFDLEGASEGIVGKRASR